MKGLRRIALAAAVVLGLLLVAAFVLNNIYPSPITAAKAAVVERGWPEENLVFPPSVHTSAKLSGSSGTVEFTVDNQDSPKSIRVTLQKPLYALSWDIVDCTELAGPDKE